jgi:hypothetical protein
MLMWVKNWWYVGASAGCALRGAPAVSAFGALCFGALFGPDDPPEHPATIIAVAAMTTTSRLILYVPRMCLTPCQELFCGTRDRHPFE